MSTLKSRVSDIIGSHEKIKISDAVLKIEQEIGITATEARYALRAALDEGFVCTDKNFMLSASRKGKAT